MKTTLSIHEADWLRIHGCSVVYVDCDAQRLGYRYARDAAAKMDLVHLQGPEQVLKELPKLEQKYDVVVVDTPGGLNDTTGAVLHLADIALIPTPPGYMDLQGTEWTAETIKAIQKGRGGMPQTGIIATRFHRDRKTHKNLRRKAKSLHFGFVEAGVPEMQIIETARGIRNDDDTGWESPPKLVWEMGRRKEVRDAALAFDAVFQEVFAGACAEDPGRIARMVTPKSKWKIENKEDYDRRSVANS